MIKILIKILDFISDLPITIFFNFYYLPIKDAIKLPFKVSHRIKIKNMGRRKSISVKEFAKPILIGKNGSFNLGHSEKTYWDINKDANVNFNGSATFGRGTKIVCNKNSTISFGSNFYCNANCIINSDGDLEFGDNVLIGWNTQILTGDGHRVSESGFDKKVNPKGSIKIGNHVWIASNVIVLNNANINNDSVVATKALVSKKFNESNIIIGKYNEILRKNINWEK